MKNNKKMRRTRKKRGGTIGGRRKKIKKTIKRKGGERRRDTPTVSNNDNRNDDNVHHNVHDNDDNDITPPLQLQDVTDLDDNNLISGVTDEELRREYSPSDRQAYLWSMTNMLRNHPNQQLVKTALDNLNERITKIDEDELIQEIRQDEIRRRRNRGGSKKNKQKKKRKMTRRKRKKIKGGMDLETGLYPKSLKGKKTFRIDEGSNKIKLIPTNEENEIEYFKDINEQANKFQERNLEIAREEEGRYFPDDLSDISDDEKINKKVKNINKDMIDDSSSSSTTTPTIFTSEIGI